MCFLPVLFLTNLVYSSLAYAISRTYISSGLFSVFVFSFCFVRIFGIHFPYSSRSLARLHPIHFNPFFFFLLFISFSKFQLTFFSVFMLILLPLFFLLLIIFLHYYYYYYYYYIPIIIIIIACSISSISNSSSSSSSSNLFSFHQRNNYGTIDVNSRYLLITVILVSLISWQHYHSVQCIPPS